MKALVYTAYDPPDVVRLAEIPTPADLLFDAVGKLAPARGKQALKPGGVFLNVHADLEGGDNLANLLAPKDIIDAGGGSGARSGGTGTTCSPESRSTTGMSRARRGGAPRRAVV